MWYDITRYLKCKLHSTTLSLLHQVWAEVQVYVYSKPYMCTLYLVDLSLLSRHPLDSMFGHLLLFLLGVLLGDVGKGVVGLVVATIKVIPGSVQTLQE